LQQLRQDTNAGIVAVGAASDARQVLRIVRMGAYDFIDAAGDLERELAELLKRFCAIEDRPQEQGKVISVISPSGGSGCSFLASNLATTLAKAHGRCALCDMDLRRGDLVSYLNLKPRHTINDLCRNLNRLDQGMFQQSLLAHESGVHLLAAPDSFTDVQQITPAAAERIVKLAKGSFPFVVVDQEDFFHREQFQILQMSDVILLVLRLDFTSLRNARRTIDYLKGEGIDPDKIKIVVNRYGRPKELPVGEAEEALGVKFAHFIPDDPKTAGMSLNRGVPAVQYAPKAKLTYAIAEIAKAVAKEELVAV
jgi:pilus assembly protein CpaE